MTKIAVIENDRALRTSLTKSLKAKKFDVVSYNDEKTALDDLKALPDLAVINLNVASTDWLDLISFLRKQEIPFILTGDKKADEIDEILGFRLGADAFLASPFTSELLNLRIHTILRRTGSVKKVFHKEAASWKYPIPGLAIDESRYQCTWKDQNVVLTKTEFDLLLALAIRPGTIKTRAVLGEAIYGMPGYGDNRNVDTFIKKLRKAFKRVDAKFDRIDTARGLGYYLRVGNQPPRHRYIPPPR